MNYMLSYDELLSLTTNRNPATRYTAELHPLNLDNCRLPYDELLFLTTNRNPVTRYTAELHPLNLNEQPNRGHLAELFDPSGREAEKGGHRVRAPSLTSTVGPRLRALGQHSRLSTLGPTLAPKSARTSYVTSAKSHGC